MYVIPKLNDRKASNLTEQNKIYRVKIVSKIDSKWNEN